VLARFDEQPPQARLGLLTAAASVIGNTAVPCAASQSFFFRTASASRSLINHERASRFRRIAPKPALCARSEEDDYLSSQTSSNLNPL
jgi:hypothetical protein